MEKSGLVVGVCVSQRRTDPKKNVGRDGTLLRVGEAKLIQGHSILPKDGVFCKVIESGEVKVGDAVTMIEG